MYMSDIGISFSEQNAILASLRIRRLDFNYCKGKGRRGNKVVLDETLKQSLLKILRTRTSVLAFSKLKTGCDKLCDYFEIEQNKIPKNCNFRGNFSARVHKAQKNIPADSVFLFRLVDDLQIRSNLYRAVKKAQIELPFIQRGLRKWYYISPEYWKQNKATICSKIENVSTSTENKEHLLYFYGKCNKAFEK